MDYVASEARRAAAIVLARTEPCLVARQAPDLAASVAVVTALLGLEIAKVRRHAFETLRDVQPPALLAPVAALLLERAGGSSCTARELSELSYLLQRVPDADLERTAQVLPPTRTLLTRVAGTPSLLRQRRRLALRVLIRIAGPRLDTLLRDAQAGTECCQPTAMDTLTDEAKEARLDGLLDDVASAICGLGGEGEDPLCELAGRFVAAVEAPGGASAERHAKSAALGCSGLIGCAMASSPIGERRRCADDAASTRPKVRSGCCALRPKSKSLL